MVAWDPRLEQHRVSAELGEEQWIVPVDFDQEAYEFMTFVKVIGIVR